MKTSIQYKLLYALFRTIGVNKMLDKKDADFDKLLESCRDKQKKPLKVLISVLFMMIWVVVAQSVLKHLRS